MNPDTECIVLASKEVGYQCLSYLIKINEQIDHVFVGIDDQEIHRLCTSSALNWSDCTEKNIYDFMRNHKLVRWLLNFWSPLILNNTVLEFAKHRLNIHPGLVPNCRGNDSAAWCIRRDIRAGVSLLEMTNELDGGNVYSQSEVEVKPTDIGRTLHSRQISAAVSLFERDWLKIKSGEILPIPQDMGGNFFTRSDTDQDRIRTIENLPKGLDFETWVRSHDFSPNTCAEIVLSNGQVFELRRKPET